MLRADLHLHSTHSDGRLAPARLVAEAAACGLTAISLTDHDSFSGYREAAEAGRELGVSVLPGIEITTSFKQREVHLLGYAFNPNDQAFAAFASEQQQCRERRLIRILEKLDELGVSIRRDELPAPESGTPGRPHIASALVRKGVVRTGKEAFVRFLGENAKAYVPLLFTPIASAIEAIHRAGGAAVLAHPANRFGDDDLEQLVQDGLDGIEYLHPSHDYPLQRKHAAWAEKKGLLATGGSDYHGFSSRDRQFLGIVTIDIKLVAYLRQKAAFYRTESLHENI